MPQNKGQDHHRWVGDEVCSQALHVWLRRNFPKSGVCSSCGVESRTEWSFLHHPKRHTRNINDYQELCTKCHRRKDWYERDETTEDRGLSFRGRKHSKETREKMAASRRGRKHSPETRAKMSQAAKLRGSKWLDE